jgi:hypothetical protein
MKKKLLLTISIIFGLLTMNAQTTHNLNWFAGQGTNVDLTIISGDTVIWTWTSSSHTVENEVAPNGNAVETFNSGFLGPIGSTFSYTFTVVGTNDYFCGVHGAASMSGTITVQENLGVEDFESGSSFNVYPNPSDSRLNIQLKQGIINGQIEIFDMLGKQVINHTLNSENLSTINISELNSGLYLIKVSFEGSSETKRFVKN